MCPWRSTILKPTPDSVPSIIRSYYYDHGYLRMTYLRFGARGMAARKRQPETRTDRSQTVGAGEFKAHCLRLMDWVAESRGEIVITKHGRPVAKLVPADDEPPDSFGALRGTVVYRGDIVSPDHDAWNEAS